MYLNQSPHQLRVNAFMLAAKQQVPLTPTLPNGDVRLLRAKLILEEALETVEALGFNIFTDMDGIQDTENLKLIPLDEYSMSPAKFCEVVDGCCDVSVVTIGTLSALGVADEPVLKITDENNLAKFGPGHSWREDGKLVKPSGHKPPDYYRHLFGRE